MNKDKKISQLIGVIDSLQARIQILQDDTNLLPDIPEGFFLDIIMHKPDESTGIWSAVVSFKGIKYYGISLSPKEAVLKACSNAKNNTCVFESEEK